VRRILANILVLYSFQQASGIDVIVLYNLLVFKKASISSNNAFLATTVAVSKVQMMSIFVVRVFVEPSRPPGDPPTS